MVTQKPFSIGDNVCFTLGTTPIRGVVIEDRGPIGTNRVRIYRVLIPNDPYDDEFIEMPGDELVIAQDQVASIPESSAVEYLKHGGLLQILKANLSGGKTQPRVWLTRDRLGNVVHTFIAERGSLGGATVPFAALHNNRVFAPKRDEVLAFLATFNLSNEGVESIIDAVGIAP
ncbi:MAG: hypothetical protein GXX96_39555 [Planctomycetaceae bacterium]|nr:hypothetical protein [Planctomycetaceae bacterium]